MAFAAEGDSTDVQIENMVEGDTCTYRIKTKCGAPGFRLQS